LQPTPLRKYRIPGYPTRLEVLEQPELLERHLPPGWRATAEMASVAAMLLAANGCSRSEPPSQPPKPKPGIVAPMHEAAKPEAAVVTSMSEQGQRRGSADFEEGALPVSPSGEEVLQVIAEDSKSPAELGAAIIAPIFGHGEGRAFSGGVVASNEFLSEEEALQVITEELSQAGIDVSNRSVELKEIRIPRRREGDKLEPGWWDTQFCEGSTGKPLNVDILDRKHRVAVEYVSESDYFNQGGQKSDSTVQRFWFREVAGHVAQKVGIQGRGIHFGVFYDPCGRPVVESKRLLRLQVKDFIDWLKGQGVI
jgi:hypothetical protein